MRFVLLPRVEVCEGAHAGDDHASESNCDWLVLIDRHTKSDEALIDGFERQSELR